MVQLRTHGETIIKIEIPHAAARRRMIPQGGPVTWQTRHSKVKHDCASKFRVFSDGEPPCTRHANEYERSLRSRVRLDRFRGGTEAWAMESNGADSSPNTYQETTSEAAQEDPPQTLYTPSQTKFTK